MDRTGRWVSVGERRGRKRHPSKLIFFLSYNFSTSLKIDKIQEHAKPYQKSLHISISTPEMTFFQRHISSPLLPPTPPLPPPNPPPPLQHAPRREMLRKPIRPVQRYQAGWRNGAHRKLLGAEAMETSATKRANANMCDNSARAAASIEGRQS